MPLEPKPPPFQPGRPFPGATSLNMIVEAVLRQLRGSGGTRVSYYGDRVSIDSPLDGTFVPDVTNYATQFVVLEERENYLLCAPFVQPNNLPETVNPGAAFLGAWVPQEYDPNLGKDSMMQVAVAKPYLLQKSPWDGKTVGGVEYDYSGQPVGRRLASNSQQLIAPAYLPGEVILAARSVTGLLDHRDYVVAWTDLNTAGRKWEGGSTNTGAFVTLGVSLPVSFQTVTVIPWDTEEWDTGDYFALDAPTRFTVQSAGIYNIQCAVQAVPFGGGTFYNWVLMLAYGREGDPNTTYVGFAGDRWQEAGSASDGQWAVPLKASGLVKLNAGDWVIAMVYLDNGTSVGSHIAQSRTITPLSGSVVPGGFSIAKVG